MKEHEVIEHKVVRLTVSKKFLFYDKTIQAGEEGIIVHIAEGFKDVLMIEFNRIQEVIPVHINDLELVESCHC